MPARQPAAFISYSREDSEFALRLAHDLKDAGAFVWLDQLDIRVGSPWDNAIEDALSEAPQVLIVLSPSSARSDNVRNEVSYALEQGKNIIPVLYMDCVVPLRLQRTQRIDFRADYTSGLTALLEHLHVARPDPSVLQKAAEGDALRHAAWKAREAEAQRLREMEDSRERDEASGTTRYGVREEQRNAEREAVERKERQVRSNSRRASEFGQSGSHWQPPKAGWEQIKSKAPLILSAVVVVLVVVLVFVLHSHPTQSLQGNSGAGTQQSGSAGGMTGSGQQDGSSGSSSPTNPVQPPKQHESTVTPPVVPSNAGSAYEQAEADYNSNDYTNAAPLYKQACDLGAAKGCTMLGFLSASGNGVSKDPQKGAVLYKKACDGGDSRGCFALGWDYAHGDGVLLDAQKAVALYQKACDGGDSVGCSNLAARYETGDGVAQSVSRAKELYQKACNLGDHRSCDALKRAIFQ